MIIQMRKGYNDYLGVSDEMTTSVGRNAKVSDDLKITGEVFIELFGPDGELKEYRHVTNLVVTAGKNHIADQLSSTPGQAAMSHMAIGTGSTAAAAGDTALGTETDRNALTSRTDASNVITYVGDWAAGDGTNAALREAGVFNAASSGTMLCRAVYTLIDKGASDTLKITWNITIG